MTVPNPRRHWVTVLDAAGKKDLLTRELGIEGVLLATEIVWRESA